MRVRTVFISSRMEELAEERCAAFDAIHDTRFVPIMFETAPSTRIKKQIDALVDRADVFLALFHSTIGTINQALYCLPPIEYEFYRFILKCHHERQSAQSEMPEQFVANHLGTDRFAQFRGEFERQISERHGPYFDVLSQRMLFYFKQGTTARLEPRLLELLKPFGATSHEVRPADGCSPPIYPRPKEVVFEALSSEFGRRVRDGSFEPADQAQGPLLSIVIGIRNEMDQLAPALNVLFENLLNIRALRHAQERLMISAEPFYGRYESRKQVTALRRRVETALRNEITGAWDVEVRAADHDRHQQSDATPCVGGERPSYLAQIQAADVPGVLLWIVERIHAANATLLSIKHGPSHGVQPRQVYLELGFALGGPDADQRLVVLHHRLRHTIGVRSASVKTHAAEEQRGS